MNPLISAKGLSKSYGKFKALDAIDVEIAPGAIAGLIGPNGAGKTTAMKAMLGLCDFTGDLQVCGHDPREQRHLLMQDVCFIADVGILPKWMQARQAIEYLSGVHPRFDRNKAQQLLAKTSINPHSRIKTLSKGMVTQLHLALVMAIDVKLLILDEPTLGLDIMYRKEFYDRLLSDYCDQEKTVLISTHQVEEIEALLTHLLFIRKGRLILDSSMDAIPDTFHEVLVAPEATTHARLYNPLHERKLLGRIAFIYHNQDPEVLRSLGEVHTPAISDLFVAMMQGAQE
ncbi:MAG: ABC transporter ATP-binding protein [Pseudomonadales bacterium]|nr:ABC transporter ATP-binding protein [Pseudomonadales bacterium]